MKRKFIKKVEQRENEHRPHYVCIGECGGDSKDGGTCQAESCSRYGEDLIECNCKDWKHEPHTKIEKRRPRPRRD